MKIKEYKSYTNKHLDVNLLIYCEKLVREKNCGNCYPQQLMYEYNKQSKFLHLPKLNTTDCKVLLGENE